MKISLRKTILRRIAGSLITFSIAGGPLNALTQAYRDGGDSASADSALGISTIRLWPGESPGAKGQAPADIPTLTLIKPSNPNGTAVIVAPGGAYIELEANKEGRQPADRLAELGITVFILKNRLGPGYLFPVPLNDARRAVKVVRSLAKEYGYSPDHIGIMGFSAGGHLAAITAMLPLPGAPLDPDFVERESSQVNFLILVYPWLNAMQPQVPSDGGLMINYCSVIPHLTQDLCRSLDSSYTPTKHITASSPPSILFASTDDRVVPVDTDVEFYRAMQKAGRDCELHLFAHGQHGFGLGGSNLQLSAWPFLLENWLRGRALLGP